MANKRYIVALSEEERAELQVILKRKVLSARKRTAALVLLKIDQGEFGPGWTDQQAAEAFDCHPNHCATLRQRLVERGFEQVLERKKQDRPSRRRKLDESAEQELVAVAQSDPPEGRARWTLRLLANRAIELQIVDGSISYETVRRGLKKTTSSRIAKSDG